MPLNQGLISKLWVHGCSSHVHTKSTFVSRLCLFTAFSDTRSYLVPFPPFKEGAICFVHVGWLVSFSVGWWVSHILCNRKLKNALLQKLQTWSVDSPWCVNWPCQYSGLYVKGQRSCLFSWHECFTNIFCWQICRA